MDGRPLLYSQRLARVRARDAMERSEEGCVDKDWLWLLGWRLMGPGKKGGLMDARRHR